MDTSFKIGSTMERISDDDIANGLLQETMKVLRETDENVFLIKISKSYFPDRQHRDGSWDVPIPLFYEQKMKDEHFGCNFWELAKNKFQSQRDIYAKDEKLKIFEMMKT